MRVKVIKIGGNIVDNPSALDSFLGDFAKIECGKILVHGGGKVATRLSATLGIETTMIDGRRVTDLETVGVITMVYAGGINKSIVAQLAGKGVKAWGLCGADGAIIPSHRELINGIDYGYVGVVDIDKINTDALSMLLSSGYSVVVAPLTMDSTGQILNTNADTIAQSVAVALSGLYDVELTYLFEKPGVLLDVDDPNSVISSITKESFIELKSSKKIFDGMLPKIENALCAIESGVSSVKISNSLNAESGTVIRK